MLGQHHAAKEYNCSICGNKINKGDLYQKITNPQYYISNDFIPLPLIQLCNHCKIDSSVGHRQIVTLYMLRQILSSTKINKMIINNVITYNDTWHGKNHNVLDKLVEDIHRLLEVK